MPDFGLEPMTLFVFIILVLVVSGLGLYISRISRAKAAPPAEAPPAAEPPAANPPAA